VCALGSEYTFRTLAGAPADPVAQYVSQSLSCARLTASGACNSKDGCAWDPSFDDGQQGCFLSEEGQLAIQQLCVLPRYARPLGALQACAAQRRACQCADAASCAAVSAAGACQPLLGCWLSRLAGAPFDVLALAQAQLLRVGPLLATLTPNATVSGLAGGGGGGRRRLLQPTGLNDPLFDDSASPSKKKPASVSASPAAPALVSAAAVPEEGGQNKPILSDTAALSGGGGSSGSGSAGSGGNELGTLESAAVFDNGVIQAGILQPETTVPTLPAASPTQPADGDALTYAPPSFWKCLQDGAVAADPTTSWAAVDYNSKKLSLDTWLGTIHTMVGRGPARRGGAGRDGTGWDVGCLHGAAARQSQG
jgi:hypothetical protein